MEYPPTEFYLVIVVSTNRIFATGIFFGELFFGVWGQKPILNDGQEGGWYGPYYGLVRI